MTQLYDARFFDWVNLTATRSARAVLPAMQACATVRSVVDVGCGQGAWLAVWAECGVDDVLGLDGAYVDINRLLIAPKFFAAADLAGGFGAPRRFDLAQSLEVAEHLPPGAGPAFVAGLCALSDVVLFSAAQPGQGGEAHLNERAPSYWAKQFETHGYAAYDALRPKLAADRSVAPWYRFNTVLYANETGTARLSAETKAALCFDLSRLDQAGDLSWTLRRLVLRPLPEPVVTRLSRLRYRLTCALDRDGTSARAA